MHVWVLSQGSPCEICDEQITMGQVYLQELRFFLSIILPAILHTYIFYHQHYILVNSDSDSVAN